MAYIMYVCPECRKIFKVDGAGKKAKCPKCTDPLLTDTSIAEEVWKTYSPEKRNEIISELIDGPEIVEAFEEPDEASNTEKKAEEKPKDTYTSFFDLGENDNTPGFFGMQNSPQPKMNDSYDRATVSKFDQKIVTEKKKHSTLSIIGLILSIIGLTTIIGLILNIIDLVKGRKDDYKHTLAKVGIGFTSAYIALLITLDILGVGGIFTSLSAYGDLKPLEIKDYGWYVNPVTVYSDSAYVEFCGVIHNPNKGVVAEFPKLLVTVKNPDGTILASEEQTGSIIMPGDTITLCGMFSMPISDVTDDTQIYVNTECNNFSLNSDMYPMVSTEELVISNVSEHNTLMENFITGEVANNSSTDLDMVNVSMILRKNGKIVFMEDTFVDNLPAGGKKAFEFQRFDRWPEHDKIECSALVW